MARKGEPDLSMMYASTAIAGTVIASGMINLAHAVREARWDIQEAKILARNEQRATLLKATFPELKLQFNLLLDRLDKRRRDVYFGATEMAAFEAQLEFEASYGEYQNVSNGFSLANLLRELTLKLRDRIDELDAQAESEATSLIEEIGS